MADSVSVLEAASWPPFPLSVVFLRNKRLGSRSGKVRCYHAAGADVGRTLITTPELSDSVNHLLLRAGKSSISSGA